LLGRSLRRSRPIADEGACLRIPFFLTLVAVSFVASEAPAANCRIPNFNFNVTSEGPWPARMTVTSGESCGSQRWSFTTMVPNRLFLVTAPQHGRVVLSSPGGYRYHPAAGFVGSDSFTLKLCGTKNGGYQGCANLIFSVNVVNGPV
jgi:hypothetical protein